MISSFVRALISAFKAHRELVPADELNRRHNPKNGQSEEEELQFGKTRPGMYSLGDHQDIPYPLLIGGLSGRRCNRICDHNGKRCRNETRNVSFHGPSSFREKTDTWSKVKC